ncbi:glucose-1-phosphate adenylyltransferase large subunit 3, chloroplastic/amyloplastic-like [Eucalyptus grandis]|uniref:glucose-1-phosphate adenylyltransferase large subunit 3, chloroplastic/amyloplastic-like n=1 Tax=Eucalyptus grandis TaxID=71139 RepID=UPI00192F087E|nr:glucose-1-phosphate adenylyltransferase large subunit 3, chloroplastic/amyloplastic-like [Eucalyptus grandis]
MNLVTLHLSSNSLSYQSLANCSSFLQVVDSIVSHGSFLNNCFIEHSVVGIRSRINANVHLKDTVMLGADFYETDAEVAAQFAKGKAPIGIGENTKIRDCIIDKNARIGKNVVIAILREYKKLIDLRKAFTSDPASASS